MRGRLFTTICVQGTAAFGLLWLMGCISSPDMPPKQRPPNHWPGGTQIQSDLEFPAVMDPNRPPDDTAVSVQIKQAMQLAALQQQVSDLTQRLALRASPHQRIEYLDSKLCEKSTDKQFQTVGFDSAPSTEHARTAELLELPKPDALAPAQTVSDTFIETDVREAIQSLATQAGVTTLVDDEVRGVVTATIEQRSIESALRQTLIPLGFVYRSVGDTIYIGSPNPESPLFNWLAEHYRYTAVHRSPQQLVELMPERFHRFLRVSDQGGWLIVEAPHDYAQQILTELEQLDQAVPQVVLEALICVYSPETNFRFGFDLDSGVRVFDRTTRLAVNSLNVVGNIGDLPMKGDLNTFTNTNAVLRCLEQQGFVKIRAAPRVMAQDGQKARIHIGRESFFSVQPEVTNLLLRQDIQQVESGIVLEITPTIRDPYVTVAIERAEVSEDIRANETQSNSTDRFPVINRRSVATTVQISDGKTIVIGGLTQRQKVNVFNRVPVLGSIPVVGKLFRRVERQDQKAEVAIFISPRIVKEHECSDCVAPLELGNPADPGQPE